MKVSSKVALGATLLVGLLLLALWRDMTLVQRLVAAHREISHVRLFAVTSTLDVLRALEQGEEDLQKLFVIRDEAYAERLERTGQSVVRTLSSQAQMALNADELAAVNACLVHWQAFLSRFAANRASLTVAMSNDDVEMRQDLSARLRDASESALNLLATLQRGIELEVAASQRAAKQGELVSLAFAVLAVLSGLLFVVLTVRSVKRPLSRLIAATRAIGDGRFRKISPQGGDEFAELARAFDTMVEKLSELDQMKRDFVSRVSHELKTPLSAMQETNQLLLDEIVGSLNDKQRRMLTLNRDAAKRLGSMLSRLLDASRLEAGAVVYDVRPLDLGSLLTTAHGEFEARMADKDMKPTLRLPEKRIAVFGDRDWLVQLVENLLENAIRYSPRGTAIELGLVVATGAELVAWAPARVHAILQAGTWALLSVSDSGPGIADAAKERVFEKFFQVQDRRVKDAAHRGHGVGLGLAICRDVANAHGGCMWVADRVGGGSTFFVALPFGAEVSSESSYANDDDETVAVGADGDVLGLRDAKSRR